MKHKVDCPKCGYRWEHSGTSGTHISCPNCRASISRSTTSDQGIAQIEKRVDQLEETAAQLHDTLQKLNKKMERMTEDEQIKTHTNGHSKKLETIDIRAPLNTDDITELYEEDTQEDETEEDEILEAEDAAIPQGSTFSDSSYKDLYEEDNEDYNGLYEDQQSKETKKNNSSSPLDEIETPDQAPKPSTKYTNQEPNPRSEPEQPEFEEDPLKQRENKQEQNNTNGEHTQQPTKPKKRYREQNRKSKPDPNYTFPCPTCKTTMQGSPDQCSECGTQFNWG